MSAPAAVSAGSCLSATSSRENDIARRSLRKRHPKSTWETCSSRCGSSTSTTWSWSRAELYGMEVADLRQADPEPEALSLIPDCVAREHFVLPIVLDDDRPPRRDGRPAHACSSPTLLVEQSGHAVHPMLAPLSEIRRAIENNYRTIGGLDQLVQAFEATDGSRWRNLDTKTLTPEVVADDAPVVQVVGRILIQAMRDRASDVHIEPSESVHPGSLPDRWRAQRGPDAAVLHGRWV